MRDGCACLPKCGLPLGKWRGWWALGGGGVAMEMKLVEDCGGKESNEVEEGGNKKSNEGAGGQAGRQLGEGCSS